MTDRNFKFSERSNSKLDGVDERLIRVATLALQLSPVDFGITEGVRTLERQKELVKAGASRTLRSKHLEGKAIDVVAYVGGKVAWDWPLYEKIAKAFKQAADELDVKIKWGGDWVTFKDGPHFQLEE